MRPRRRADVGVVTDLNALEEFVVSSKFVRADAPLGAVPGGGNVNVVAKGHTVRPSELARARKNGDVGGGGEDPAAEGDWSELHRARQGSARRGASEARGARRAAQEGRERAGGEAGVGREQAKVQGDSLDVM